MIENVVFHFVAVFFIISMFVWWVLVKIKLESVEKSLIPVLLLKTIEWPRHRSLVVRSFDYLKTELSNKFKCEIELNFYHSREGSHSCENFVTLICFLLLNVKEESFKVFLIQKDLFSNLEFISYVKLIKNKKKLIFNYDIQKNIWNVEILYES